jgi:hypothetical protein
MRQSCFASFVLFVAVPAASGATNVNPSHPYAWGENVGWLNWHDANGGVDGACLRATFLSGFIWAENIGYINLGDGTPANGTRYANANGSDFGVNVDTNGDLFGLAWGENVGWVNFDTRTSLRPYSQQTRLDSTAGRLRGYAWGENVGWINLDDASRYVAFGVSAPADFDGDGDVDLADFGLFQGCFNGPNRPPAQSGCGSVDFDNDHDIDLADFGVFQGCFNGPNRPPACQ